MAPDQQISQSRLFWQQFRQHFIEVGAFLPSSRWLAGGMTAYLARKQGQVNVLEAGAGTGPFTGKILSYLQPGDAFDVVEINPQLFAALQHKFGPGSGSVPEGVTVRWINDDVRTLPRQPVYDHIVFSLPLTNFPPALVDEILTQMMDCLKPGGVFSYVKYIFISRFKYWFGGSAVRAEMDANQAIIERFTHQYQIERRAVWRNAPPAWVYYWRKK